MWEEKVRDIDGVEAMQESHYKFILCLLETRDEMYQSKGST